MIKNPCYWLPTGIDENGYLVDTFGHLIDRYEGKFIRCNICNAQVKSTPPLKPYCVDYLLHKWDDGQSKRDNKVTFANRLHVFINRVFCNRNLRR